MESNIDYSIVVPVFNSEATIDSLTTRILSISELTEKFEIIYIDDCSRDNSWNTLKNLAKNNKNIKIIHLLKNYGQYSATFCGFQYSSGKYVITLDDDLQNPPEEIPKLIKKMSEGYSVVYARYPKKNHNRIENFFSSFFQGLIHDILKIPANIFVSSFAIYKRDVIDRIKSVETSKVFLPALVSMYVPLYAVANVDVDHHPRKFGRSNYSFGKYVGLFFNLTINYSSFLLRIVGIFGFLISLLSFVYALYIIFRSLFDPAYGYIGWNSLMVAITFLGGTILVSIAIIGEYLSRILREVAHEQPYIIDEIKL